MSFAYNASAVALGGRIVLPSPTIIESQASVALAPTGGVGRQSIQRFNYNDIITFDEASVYVTGSQEGDVFNTLSTVSVKNLNVRNVLHADLLFGSITSRHEKGAKEGEITFNGTSVDNLKIDGRLIDPRFNHGFFAHYPTYESMVAVLRDDVAGSSYPEVKAWVEEEVTKEQAKGDPSFDEPAFRAALGRLNVAGLVKDRFCFTQSDKGYGVVPDDGGLIHCSLVDDIPGIEEMSDQAEAAIAPDVLRKQHPFRRHGFVIKLAGVGTIKLAEVVIKPGEKHLNMLRFEFGCPITGDMTVGSVTTNGTELIP